MGLAFAALLATALTVPAMAAAVPLPDTGSAGGELNGILDQLTGRNPGDKTNVTGQTSQLIVVNAKAASDTTGTLTAYERGADGNWKPVVGPTTAHLGSKGQGEPADNVPRTPSGTFALDQAFGRKANPGTKMPYKQVTVDDWWDSDMKSKTYNTLVHHKGKPSADAENLYNSGPVYDYAVNIAHNPSRVPGKASAIFLHVTNGQPTEGCVAVGQSEMVKILKWLDPAKSPKITIGVNAQAPSGDAAGASPQNMKDSPNGAAGGLLGGIVEGALNILPQILGKVGQS
ncbi:L,D-transpeptidase [Gordonia sp. X0973]|uniref:L,D-transpeptidase family protein n=1 Tax=Gordonia sp. X0973 TaxID=2742602 RepID=UPI0026573FB5|nr:L,D-transpeptidase family protein [Gordonia sp. X0973]